MTLDQIKTLVASGESATLEFKATTGTRREAAATVCAMKPTGWAHSVRHRFSGQRNQPKHR